MSTLLITLGLILLFLILLGLTISSRFLIDKLKRRVLELDLNLEKTSRDLLRLEETVSVLKQSLKQNEDSLTYKEDKNIEGELHDKEIEIELNPNGYSNIEDHPIQLVSKGHANHLINIEITWN